MHGVAGHLHFARARVLRSVARHVVKVCFLVGLRCVRQLDAWLAFLFWLRLRLDRASAARTHLDAIAGHLVRSVVALVDFVAGVPIALRRLRNVRQRLVALRSLFRSAVALDAVWRAFLRFLDAIGRVLHNLGLTRRRGLWHQDFMLALRPGRVRRDGR